MLALQKILNLKDKEIKDLKEVNEEHRKLNGKLREEIEELEKINKMYIVRLPKDNGDFEARHILYKKEHLKAFLGLLSCHKSELLFNEQVRKYNQLIRRK